MSTTLAEELLCGGARGRKGNYHTPATDWAKGYKRALLDLAGHDLP